MTITCTFDDAQHKVVPIELINAIEKLVKCRGRYHTQQNFELLQSAFAKHQAAPPYPADTNIVETLDSSKGEYICCGGYTPCRGECSIFEAAPKGE